MSTKAVKAYFGTSSVGVGYSVSSLAEFRKKVSELVGLEEDRFYLLEDGASVVEDEDYFQTAAKNVTLHVVKKTADDLCKEEKIRQNDKQLNNELSNSNNIIENEPKSIEDEEISPFEKNAMEFMRKIVLKDPSILPAESVPLFWRYCESIGDKNMANYAKNLFIKTPLDVFSSEGSKEMTISQWEEIVQWEHIQCTEFEILASLFKWAHLSGKINDNRIKENIIPHIRLGQFTLPQLLKDVHPLHSIFAAELVYPFVRYHLLSKEKSAAFFEQNKKLFELREFQKENYKLGQLISRDAPITVTAKGRPWVLTMSSQYVGLPNNYETLTSGNWNQPGCATNYGPAPGCEYQFIQATYDMPVFVSKVIVSSPTKGTFAAQGWGNGYISQLSIQYSKEDDGPFELVKSLAGTVEKDGPIEIDISDKNIIGKRFRLTSVGYVATASFILE